MGMTIEEAIKHLERILVNEKENQFYVFSTTSISVAIETMRKYQQLQADYENRLKADMIAMLTEIQLEIEECVDGAEGSPQFEQGVTTARVQVVEIIQQKINELKQESTTKTDKVDCKHTDCNNCVNHKYCDYEPTTKNDLGVDCVARQDVERFIEGFINEYTPEEELEFINLELDGLKHLPPATPQEPTDKNFTKADIDAIVKAINEGWELRVNEVLDKIRAEIEQSYCEVNNDYDQGRNYGLYMATQIIDKYRAESEPQESEEKA